MTTVLDRESLSHEPPGNGRLLLRDDDAQWTLYAVEAREAARLRHAFRDYLEAFGHPASDFDAAEHVYGELTGNCVRHAPGPVRITFRWDDSTLSVADAADRLRTWPFSENDTRAECTHHAYAIVSALTGCVRLTRDPDGGTRASVVLPVMRATT